MVIWVQIALLAIAANAVLIQTVVTEDSPLKNIIRVSVLAITLFVMFARRTIVPIWTVLLVLLSVCLLLVTQNPDQLTLVYLLLLVPAMWSIDERALTRAVMIASLFSLGLVFAFLGVGLTANELLTSQTWVSADIRSRYTFGTAGVPFFMNVVFGAAVTTIYHFYRWKVRRRLLVAIVVLAWAMWVFTQTDGRGGFYGILAFCILALCMRSLIKLTFIRTVLALQPLIFLALAAWLGTQRDDPTINQLFSFRPMLFGQFLDGVTLWHMLTSITVKHGTVATVDNSYLHLLYGAGLVLFVAFCYMFGRAVITMSRRTMTLELAFLTSVMIYAALESILLRADNVFVLFTWYLIMRYSMGAKATDPRALVDASMERLRAADRVDTHSGGWAATRDRNTSRAAS
ncbi:hypothetical protein [Microbacterium sp. SS28]|uniref:hypothetical protein n=1 Tax=Microbacterium sp. SS28 TaxID=2919948 RepID=UPI001FA950BC|nr:hypothetical protein [Microbacterium sp. SS28]